MSHQLSSQLRANNGGQSDGLATLKCSKHSRGGQVGGHSMSEQHLQHDPQLPLVTGIGSKWNQEPCEPLVNG